MPAMTVKSLSDQLSSYCSPDQRFIPVLNLVLPRLYSMGYWRDLAYEYRITTSNGYFALPQDAESIMAATVDKSPQNLWAQWHDYSIGGMPNTYSAYGLFGVVDDGIHSTKEALDPTKGYNFFIIPVFPNTYLPIDGIVTIGYTYLNGTKRPVDKADLGVLYNASGEVANFDFATDDEANSILQIRFDGISVDIELIAVEAGKTYADRIVLAEGRGDQIFRYRRYRTKTPSSATQEIFLLLKRAFVPIMDESDIVYLGNVNAIKSGILATTAEDNADIERANYHWQVCKQLLEEEKDAYRGGARQVMRVDPYSGNGTPLNMY
jgi:hypothetical protein